jgi:hypothetical protein
MSILDSSILLGESRDDREETELISRNIGTVHPQFNPFRSLRTALLVVTGDCDSINPMDRVRLLQFLPLFRSSFLLLDLHHYHPLRIPLPQLSPLGERP